MDFETGFFSIVLYCVVPFVILNHKVVKNLKFVGAGLVPLLCHSETQVKNLSLRSFVITFLRMTKKGHPQEVPLQNSQDNSSVRYLLHLAH